MTQNTYSVSPKPSACLKHGVSKTPRLRHAEPGDIYLSDEVGRKPQRGSSLLLFCRPVLSGPPDLQHSPFAGTHSATWCRPFSRFCPFRPSSEPASASAASLLSRCHSHTLLCASVPLWLNC